MKYTNYEYPDHAIFSGVLWLHFSQIRGARSQTTSDFETQNGEITVLHVLVFRLLDIRQKD
jgi:hypothetical protein